MIKKKKIAILGGGMGGLSAADGLTATQELRDQYDVTVYQVGWRVGGQCGSGRSGPENRIEQNGTHYLFGCYDNTMEMAKRAYTELGDAGAKDFGAYEESLLPRDLLALKQFYRGKWEMWAWPLPVNQAEPGVKTGFLTPPEYFAMFLQWILNFILGANLGQLLRPASPFDTDRPWILRAIYAVLRPIIWVVAWILYSIGIAIFRITVDLLKLFGDPNFMIVAKVLVGIRALNTLALGRLSKRFLLFFKLYAFMDFGCTLGIGLIRDLVPSKGLSAIEEQEFRGWLSSHGASEETLYAPFIGMWYSSVAAFEDGDPLKPNLSAGVSVMAIFKAVLTYKGHFAYQMRSEMGDTIVGPIHDCLRARGVKFKFFHRVRDVVPGKGNEIEQIIIEQQVTLKSGDPASYQPFMRVNGFKAWPNDPLWDQIEQKPAVPAQNLESFYTEWRGETLPPLQRGKDFDAVVMAMPVASLPTYCSKLIKRSDKWRDMTDNVTGVETQTMRVYFNSTLKEMGWMLPTPILSNYALPFSTWEDNGHLVDVETWPKGEEPKAIATLFGPLPAPNVSPPTTDTGYPAAQLNIATANVKIFLDENVGSLWPKATTLALPPGVDWDQLVDLSNGVGAERISGQYIRANSGPLQRYTMAKAGTAQHRLAPGDSQFSNMVLAGDWTQNSFLIGSIEGAIMSGYQASRALCGSPQNIPGEDTGL